MHLKPRHRLRPLSSLLLSFALGCSGSAPEQDSSQAPASQAQRLSPSSTRALSPGLAPSRVKDIQVGTDTRLASWGKGSYSGLTPNTASRGSTFYFTAVEESTGEELWRTDGTREGTRLVRELIPGINGKRISELVTLGDTLFVSTDTATPDGALWKSDGTPEGTVRWELGEKWKSPGNPVVCNGALFFQDFNLAGAWKGLWKSDGTLEGTVEISSREWFFGFEPSNHFACANGTLFFVTSGDSELWKSDGTAEGTVLLGNLGYLGVPWDDTPLIFAAGSHVFISGSYIGGGLWASDGTPEGTTLLGSGGTGDSQLYAESLTPVGETLFFIAWESMFRQELWKSDGTAAGTQRVAELPQDGPQPGLVALGDTLLYSVASTLSRSDGTPEGTVLLKNLDLNIMPREGARLPDGRWLIIAQKGFGTAFSLWVTDGTSAGTTPLQLEGGQGFTQILGLRSHGDQVVFWAEDGIHGMEPWVTDGTPAGTRMLRDIFRGDSSNPQRLLDMGGTLFFTAYDSEHGRELWKSDGTAEGTVLVKDTSPLFSDIGPGGLTRVGETLFFFSGNQLWKSDGTEAGTLPVYTRLQSNALGAPSSLGTSLFFTTWSSAFGWELWTSNGTPEGTLLFTDINPGQGSASPTDLTQAGSTLFFSAEDGVHGREPWKTDGTPEGTVLLKDILPGRQGGIRSGFVNVGGTLFFVAEDGVHGYELWKTDGTPEGTVLLKDIRPGRQTSFISGFVNVGGTLFFIADDGLHGSELWKSDGTSEGTVLVADIAPGPTPAFQPEYRYTEGGPLYAIDGALYFTADDGAHGAALWKSDGTSEGTVLLHDLTPAGSNPLWNVPLVAVGPHGAFAFPAPEARGGLELWMSDGTTEGTRLLHDIAPDWRGASPSQLTVSGSRLFFVADEGEHGRELWSVKHAAFQQRP